MGRLSKHRKVKSIDPFAKGGSTFGKDETQKNPKRNLAPEAPSEKGERMSVKMREFARGKEMLKRQNQIQKQKKAQHQFRQKHNKKKTLNKLERKKLQEEEEKKERERERENELKRPREEYIHMTPAEPETKKRQVIATTEGAGGEAMKIKSGETMFEYKKRVGLMTRDKLRAMNKEDQQENNKQQKRKEFLVQKKQKKDEKKKEELLDSEEEEELAKEQLNTWETIKFGDIVEAPPAFNFQPKVKKGFTYHKETEGQVKGGSTSSYAAYFNKNVTDVYKERSDKRKMKKALAEEGK
eukprot:TRINITY_DN9236_c0_g1_i1.p1 TRINITY_DN9236_c0_g1~~TRINITY_DN9236_c0_g1_i1.p1  ORF type:complete len:297 (-),score=119.50 TRINITY_DN9236_c0_g1_i1:114-1004(-)